MTRTETGGARAPAATDARPIRVCQLMECTIGGTRRHIRELSVGLARRGMDVTLVASAVRDPTFREDLAAIARDGVRVVEIPMRRALGPHDLAHTLRVFSHFLRNRYDIVHTHSSKAGAVGRVASILSLRGHRRVHTPHTFAFNFTAQFGPRKRRLFLWIERALGKSTHALVNVGPSERREGIDLRIVPPERAHVICNGIDPAPYADCSGDRVRRELGLSKGDLLIGTVGLLNEAKGHADLIEAARLVSAREPRARFAIVGEGSLRDALERQIEGSGLRDRVRLLGYRNDVPEFLAACDLFCLPSLWEGMPYVLLEAMAARRAVVATDVHGCRDLIRDGETGLLVPPSDPSRLAEAIGRLLQAPDERDAIAARGRELVARDYTVTRMIDRYEALYRELIGGGER